MMDENLAISEILDRKQELKDKKLKRREVTDQLLKETLDRLSIEERFRFLYYYIMDDVYRKADS